MASSHQILEYHHDYNLDIEILAKSDLIEKVWNLTMDHHNVDLVLFFPPKHFFHSCPRMDRAHMGF